MIPAMLVGTIDLCHFMLLSVGLALAEGHMVSLQMFFCFVP